MEEVKFKFFGRRKGRVIRKAKSYLLDNFLPLVLFKAQKNKKIEDYFDQKKDKYYLEIGFGDGEHIEKLSKENKNIGFLGVEVYKNGVANLLSLITGIKEGAEVEQNENINLTSNRVDNLRIYDDDVRFLFDKIPDNSFDKVFLLFPDPWPKNKHSSRRFINEQNLKELARILKKGGVLQIATDHHVYKCWTLEQMRKNKDFVWMAKTSDDWRRPPADWYETKYQRKALREGRRPVFFEFERV